MTRKLMVEATILGEPVLHGLHDPWHVIGAAGEPGYLNAWASVAGFPVAFRKDEIGNVHIRGTCQSGTFGLPVFNLPLGYRPAVNLSWLANANPTAAIPVVSIVATTGGVTPSQKITTSTAVALNYMFTTEQ